MRMNSRNKVVHHFFENSNTTVKCFTCGGNTMPKDKGFHYSRLTKAEKRSLNDDWEKGGK